MLDFLSLRSLRSLRSLSRIDFVKSQLNLSLKFRLKLFATAISLLTMVSLQVRGAELNVVETKRQQFLKHQEKNEKYEQNRVRGLGDYLDETEKWERKKLAALEAYRRENHGAQEIKEQEKRMKQFRFHKAEMEEWAERQEKARQTFIRERDERSKKEGKHSKEWARFEIEELDLFDRPRYDFKKRNFTGGKGKSSANKYGTGGGSSGYDSYVPPPPNFPSYDSVPYDGGDIPPPPPPSFPEYDGGADIPPPPPPPPMAPPGFDQGGGSY